jgi:hypothetical protein
MEKQKIIFRTEIGREHLLTAAPERQIIDARVEIPILRAQHLNEYARHFTWEELISVKGIKPDDRIEAIIYKEQKGFYGSFDEHERIYYVPTIVVRRNRLETDEEYTSRLQKQEAFKKQNEQKEYDLYIRLKAKYEKNN